MILDELVSSERYTSLGSRFARGFRFLTDTDLSALEAGRHDIAGAEVFALVSDYDTKPRESGVWEAHRKHADIQVVVGNEELCGRTALTTLTAQPYDDEKDVLFAEGLGDYFVLRPGSFAIFFPHDAHMPGLSVSDSHPVRKVVIKVRL